MTTTALIGCDTPLGKYWSTGRYFDYLVNDANVGLLRGKEWGHVVLICPSLWASPGEIRDNLKQLEKRLANLTDVLGETKIERLTYITTLDLITDSGDENAWVVSEEKSGYLKMLAEFRDFLNLRFGRVLNLRLAELVGLEDDGPGWSVLSELAACKGRKKPKVGLLTKHQFYPMDRIINDAELAWECGLSFVNLVSEPITVFDLTEQLFPPFVDLLPLAKETDPAGSTRTSGFAVYWNNGGKPRHTIEKNEMMEKLKSLI